MATLVAKKASPVDIINVGLSLRRFSDIAGKPRVYLLEDKQYAEFWGNPEKYADRDRVLVVIGGPVIKTELSKWKPKSHLTGIYLQKKGNELERGIVKALSQKGFRVIPPRNEYECYPGDVDEYWSHVGRIVALQETGNEAGAHYRIMNVAAGIISNSVDRPHETIRMVEQNDRTNLQRLGAKANLPKDWERMARAVFAVANTKASKLIVPATFKLFIRGAKPLAALVSRNVHGVRRTASVSAILTRSPTLTRNVLVHEGANPRLVLSWPEAALFEVRGQSPSRVAMFVGRSGEADVTVRFSRPVCGLRTLRRIIIGGQTTEKRMTKRGPITYKKSYRGLKERHPTIRLHTDRRSGEGEVHAPTEALEAIIKGLERCGAKATLM